MSNENKSFENSVDSAKKEVGKTVKVDKVLNADECRIDIDTEVGCDSNSIENGGRRTVEEIINMIRSSEGAADCVSKKSKSETEYSDFEKSLFVNGVVDWKSYISRDKLFQAFNYEAINAVDVRFSSYQDGLLHLLQHCYGYFYQLKTNSERYAVDIKEIDAAISSVNLSNNKGNPLEVKIIKLVWKGSGIDRRRISTYANLLKNAWCKGEYKEGITDDNGSILPSVFANQVKLYGGINSFSRLSAEQVRKNKQLEESGYKNSKDRKIDIAREALRTGVFKYNDYELPLKNVGSLSPNTQLFNDLRDGSTVVALCSWNRDTSELVVRCSFDENDQYGVTDKAEAQFFEIMRKQAIEAKGY